MNVTIIYNGDVIPVHKTACLTLQRGLVGTQINFTAPF